MTEHWNAEAMTARLSGIELGSDYNDPDYGLRLLRDGVVASDYRAALDALTKARAEAEALAAENARLRAALEYAVHTMRYVREQAPEAIGGEPYLVSPGGFYKLTFAIRNTEAALTAATPAGTGQEG